jgi:hypothetical protein
MNMKSSRLLPLSSLVLGCALILGATHGVEAAEDPGSRSLKWRKQLMFVSPAENATVADINRDGKIDIVYGPYWFAGPNFVPQAYRPNHLSSDYHRNNSDHVYDVDGDGWPDIIAAGWNTNGRTIRGPALAM